MMNLIMVGLGTALVIEFGVMYKLLSKEYMKMKNKTFKVKCIDDTDYEWSIINDRLYDVIDEKDCGDGTTCYKIIDEFYDELWIDSYRFEKIDE